MERQEVRAGGRIFLDLQEMGACGWARVLGVKACPPVMETAGRLVTATFKHRRGLILEVGIEGEPAPIGATPGHPWWSADRQCWVQTKDLREGERLQALDGSTPRVESLALCSEPEPVYNLEVEGDHVYRVGSQGLLVHNQSVMLDFTYIRPPTVTAPCGSAEDEIRWRLTGTVPPGVHAIVQMVTRRANIERGGRATIAIQDGFFELWDVSVVAGSPPAVMGGGQDSFAWHPQAGNDTKGSWEIRGVARFLPCYDVMTSGEPWQQGVVPGAGRFLFTLPLNQPPRAWSQFSSEVARLLKAMWNCFPNETRQETDITGSGRTTS